MNLGIISNEIQTKSKNSFENIKSNFVFKKIVEYNKSLQKRLNLSINDYKEYYYQFYKTSIEI